MNFDRRGAMWIQNYLSILTVNHNTAYAKLRKYWKLITLPLSVNTYEDFKSS